MQYLKQVTTKPHDREHIQIGFYDLCLGTLQFIFRIFHLQGLLFHERLQLFDFAVFETNVFLCRAPKLSAELQFLPKFGHAFLLRFSCHKLVVQLFEVLSEEEILSLYIIVD